MENKITDRVMAYTLAKTISIEDMTEVSGGEAMTGRQTFRPSGGSIHNIDVFWDVSVDW